MSAGLAITILIAYFCMLMVIGIITSRKSNSTTFYNADRSSPWYLVAFGMVGVSLSGVTFISVPGEVGNTHWSYLALVIGNCIGYLLIAWILLPIFYKLNLISIYGWLEKRFGTTTKKSGSTLFLVSQLIGASFRLFLIVSVLQIAFFDAAGIPLWCTVLITLLFVWLYTFKGGIKTLVWTDTLQTIFMLLSLFITIVIICKEMDFSVGEAANSIAQSDYSTIFNWDWKSGQNTIKQIIAGISITIAINGLDQNMMQKNLTCSSLRECRKNMFSFSGLFLLTNILFLTMGTLLYIYANHNGIEIPEKSDQLFPTLALNYFGNFAGVCFLLGVTAAAYSSVDSSLTAMTTSFCSDIIGITPENPRPKLRIAIHLLFSLLMGAIIVIFSSTNNSSVVSAVFTAVGYTYGPILGLFLFGLCSKRAVYEKAIPYICVASPIISWFINRYSETILFGYKFGFEILLFNALITIIGLSIARLPKHS
ncbi:MAG: sodium:solute symporter [Marinifilaceae bacterium]|nr:sodium:solute symporter [Marinifilaceae bacterium]